MNIWIEHKNILYNLSNFEKIDPLIHNSIYLETSNGLEKLDFDSTEERDDFMDKIKQKLNPQRFGSDKMPC